MSDYIIGLTGGIASGKSTVDRAFAALGVFVADADVAARDALVVGSEGLHYNPITRNYWLGRGVDVNYLLALRKPEAN